MRPLPALIALSFAQISTGLMREVRAAGYKDLRLHHFMNVFRFMSGQGDRPAELARQAGVTPQAMSAVLGELEGLGYIRREPDPIDRRSQVVQWADRGLQAGQIAEGYFAKLEAEWASIVGTERLELSRDVMRLVTHGAKQEAR